MDQLNYDFGGLNTPDPDNPTSHYTISYSSFVVPLVKALKSNRTLIDVNKATAADILEVVEEQQSTIDDLKILTEEQQATISDNRNEIQLLKDIVKDLLTRVEALEH